MCIYIIKKQVKFQLTTENGLKNFGNIPHIFDSWITPIRIESWSHQLQISTDKQQALWDRETSRTRQIDKQELIDVG